MLGGTRLVKKTILLIIFTLLLMSCKNNEIVQKTNSAYLEIDKEIAVMNLSKAEELVMPLDEEAKAKYTMLIEEKKVILQSLYGVESVIKNAFYTGSFTQLDNYMKLGAINSYKYDKLKEYDLSGIKVYIGKREFSNDNVSEIAVMNFFEESIYLELLLQYDGNDWFIRSFDEKR